MKEDVGVGLKKKRILIMIHMLTGGGAEKVAANLSFYLSDSYDKYTVVYDGRHVDYSYKGELINLNLAAKKNVILKVFNFLFRVFKIRKIKRQLDIQSSISLLENANLVNIFSRGRERLIISVRSYLSKNLIGFYGRIYRKLVKRYYNYADVIIAVSKTVKQDLIENFEINEDKIKVIYNPYDIENIKKQALEDIEDEHRQLFKNTVFVNTGRLTNAKGQWHLIRAFKRVREEIEDAKLIIIGQGELEKYLKSVAKSMGLEGDVIFLGHVVNPYKFVSRSDIYVFSSLYEGFPNALLEALICSVPVIATDCKAGPREILAPDTDIDCKTIGKADFQKYGVLAPVCDGRRYYNEELTMEEVILAESIILLYNDKLKQSKYKELGYVRAKDFEYSKIIRQYEEIFN